MMILIIGFCERLPNILKCLLTRYVLAVKWRLEEFSFTGSHKLYFLEVLNKYKVSLEYDKGLYWTPTCSECKQHWRWAALAYTLSVVLYLYIGEYLYFGHGTKYVNKAGEDCIAGGGWSLVRGHFHQSRPIAAFHPSCLCALCISCILRSIRFSVKTITSQNKHTH